MKTESYAHSLKKQPMETWQPLTAYLLAVAALARKFAQGFGLTDPAVDDEAFLTSCFVTCSQQITLSDLKLVHTTWRFFLRCAVI